MTRSSTKDKIKVLQKQITSLGLSGFTQRLNPLTCLPNKVYNIIHAGGGINELISYKNCDIETEGSVEQILGQHTSASLKTKKAKQKLLSFTNQRGDPQKTRERYLTRRRHISPAWPEAYD